jgi:hypothetical protein
MEKLVAKYREMHGQHKSDVEVACCVIGFGILGCGIGLWGSLFFAYYAGCICTLIGTIGLWKTGILNGPRL